MHQNWSEINVQKDQWGGRFKNAYEGEIFCVEFQRVPLKFHSKYLTHTLKDAIFIQFWKFKSSHIHKLECVFYCHIYPRLWHGLLITWLNAIEVIVWSSNYVVISLIRFYFAKHLLFHAIVVNFVQKVLPSKVFRVGSVTGVFSMISYWHVQMDYVNVIVQISVKRHTV